MSNQERQAALTLWLEERKITMQALATAIGVSRPFVSVMLAKDTIPLKRHHQLVTLGLPAELLPPPYTGPQGRPRSTPLFPLVTREQGSEAVS